MKIYPYICMQLYQARCILTDPDGLVTRLKVKIQLEQEIQFQNPAGDNSEFG